MSEDISKRTITVLVVLTVLISLLGTLTVLNEVGRLEAGGSIAKPAPDSGRVSLTILQPESRSPPAQTTGMVGLELREPEENEEESQKILLLPENI